MRHVAASQRGRMVRFRRPGAGAIEHGAPWHRAGRDGTHRAISTVMASKRKKKDAEPRPDAPRQARSVRPIRLVDLLPKEAVKGGRKSLFGARDPGTNRADGSKRED